MLSILIPTYNQNIVRLVTGLYQQCKGQLIDFEIIVMEDGSNKFVTENSKIQEFSNCVHIILKNNIGRSAVRNKLADQAKYSHILFMDCDAKVFSKHFIDRYLPFCKEDCVVIGGTAYDATENDPKYSLRLQYGRLREARSAMERDKNNFSTFNFLIAKSIFNQVHFDETIKGYGHEDMLFGHQLHLLGHEFIQIDNPLIHQGLDDNETFIKKTEEGTRNLYLLYCTGKYPFLADESKLLHIFLLLKKGGLRRILALKFNFTAKLIKRLLSKPNPSLWLYDLYKILYLCKTSLTK